MHYIRKVISVFALIIGFSVLASCGGSDSVSNLPRISNLYFESYSLNQGDINNIYIEVSNADSWKVTGVLPDNTITPNSGSAPGTMSNFDNVAQFGQGSNPQPGFDDDGGSTYVLKYDSSANWGEETITLTATNSHGSISRSDSFTVNAVN